MELLTNNLPSGMNYSFPSINLKPLKFSQILEYMENASTNPIEKFMMDYGMVKMDDKMVDELLLTDLEYCIFIKKGLTIADNISFTSEVLCESCNNEVSIEFDLSKLKFNKYHEDLIKGIQVELSNQIYSVRMPTTKEFIHVLSNYRRLKSKIDLKIIKLISLLQESLVRPMVAEKLITDATYKDITLITALDQLYFNTVEPIKYECDHCHKSGGMEIGISHLISNLFRAVLQNNGITTTQILP